MSNTTQKLLSKVDLPRYAPPSTPVMDEGSSCSPPSQTLAVINLGSEDRHPGTYVSIRSPPLPAPHTFHLPWEIKVLFPPR